MSPLRYYTLNQSKKLNNKINDENIIIDYAMRYGRGYYIEFDDFINAVALEEEKEEEKGKEGKGGGRVNGENIIYEMYVFLLNV